MPIRILVLAANPRDTDRLRLDEEVREIQEALEQSKNRDHFEVIPRWAVRVSDLQKVLLGYPAQIVHFSGHGDGKNGLILEDKQGKAQIVNTEALAELFSLFKDTIKCVFLNACYSEIQAQAIHASIPIVIGMNQNMDDRAAVEFARGFYGALGANRTIADAFKLACNALCLVNDPNVSTPVMHCQSEVADFTIQTAEFVESSPTTPETGLTPINHTNQNRSVSIGGSVTGSAIMTGDSHTVSIHFQPTALPRSPSVNIQAELDALYELLSQIQSPDKRKIENALDDAREELKKPEPNKDEVGQALYRALHYVQKSNSDAEASNKLRPHVEKMASWLGKHWDKLLLLVGLTV